MGNSAFVKSSIATPVAANLGGTGVANNSASTITISGAFGLTFTLSATTALTLPTSGTVATLSNNLGAFAATTSAQLAGVISDETGTGALVFANSPALINPALGTPASGIATNLTGTASGLTAGNVTTNANLTGAVTSVGNTTSLGSFTSAQLASALTDETGTGMNVFAISPALVTPLLGTPTSGTLTNCTGLPVSSGISGLGTGIETWLVTPSFTNLNSAVTGDSVVGIAATQTLTNKRITRRFVTVTQSATPAINTDNTDIASITGLAQAVTSFTTSLTGTPNAGDYLMIQITDNGTARALTFGAKFTATTIALPTTTVISTLLRVGFQWNATTSVWNCIAVA